MKIPFNRPYMTGRETEYIVQAHANGQFSGDGSFTKRCQEWLAKRVQSRGALLTHSCTAALEMAAILAEVGPGDEIIMPSYTFVSTANAFVLRGAVPVFVDIRKDTLNLDEQKVEEAITRRTKVIVPVHYAGVACEMDALMEIAERRHLIVIEDAAQALMSLYKGRPLGGLGSLGALSFHETKNVMCGEGGALLINEARWVERAEILREKGTNRSRFFRGQVDKYTWVDLGSSYLPGEINAAFLYAQLEKADEITFGRLKIWDLYHEAFRQLEEAGVARRPVVPAHCQHNAHMYYLVFNGLDQRTAVIDHLRSRGMQAVFHYVPLHSSPAGQRFGRTVGALPVTNSVSDGILRLPLWLGMTERQVEEVAAAVYEAAGVRWPAMPGSDAATLGTDERIRS